MELLVLLFIFVVFLFGTPIGLSYLIFHWIKKKEFDKIYRLLAIVPLILVGYFIYDAFYPNTDFYKTDFKEVTTLDFPQNGKILYKTASFPDQFGDYTSSFLAEFNEEYIKKLEVNLKIKNFVSKENEMSSNELDYIEKRKGNIKYSAQYINDKEVGKYYSIGFLDDKKSVIVTRVSW
ncbi:hypothetical protein [Flavobacterium sp.]|jgi:hypothetical protein|uniref:hypothetical protein n=1 Tax=Flavobacterium sp. TaxID=239 RepID=UPI0037C0CA45